MSIRAQVAGQSGTPSHGEISQQVRRIAASTGFKNSDPIRQVLLYLASQALEFPGEPVKEHQIGTSALGRPSDFDPRVDSTVRVIVTRLRARLAEYYTHEGARDLVIVDVPRGAYVLTFAFRPTNEAAPRVNVTPMPATLDDGKATSDRVRPLLGLLVFAAAIAASFFAGRRSAVPSKPASLAAFWGEFLKNGDPLIVFSNPIFEGAPEEGMHLLNPATFHAEGTNDTFTGTGEVMAVHDLTEELAALGHAVKVKRARLFTWDEALAHNLIIVGGPAQSSVFLQLPQLKSLVLKPPTQPPYLGEEAVLNANAAAGRENPYFRPARRGDTGIEYAVVALTGGGPSSEHSILITAGTNTFATQAAARFVCNPILVEKLLARLKARTGQKLPHFEALLKVEIRGGAPLEPELLLLYERGD